MPRELSLPAMWTQYLAARLGVMSMMAFGVKTNLRSAAALGRLLYRTDHRHRQRTLKNLKWCFPHLDQASIEREAEKSFEHLIQLVTEICFTPRLLHPDSWSQRVRFNNLATTVDLLNNGKPVIMVAGHYGNWEITGFLLTVLGYPVDAVARPLNNPLINDWLLGIRKRHGMRIITKWNATENMLNVLHSGGSLCFIADQNAGDKGMFVPFFDRLASTYKSIGLLAMDQNVPIVCGYARRLPPNLAYEVGATDIIYPEDWLKQPDPLFYITARYIRAIETMVKDCPSQYLWMHRRWKSRPKHEKLGKPFPQSIRRKLEDLPWMDQPMLDRIIGSSALVQ